MGWYHASGCDLHYVCEPVIDFRSTPVCLIWSPRRRGSSSVGKVFLMAVNKMQDSKPLYVMPANILGAQVSHVTRANILEAEEDTLWGGVLERMNVFEPSSHLPQGPRNRHTSALLSFSLSQGPEQNTQLYCHFPYPKDRTEHSAKRVYICRSSPYFLSTTNFGDSFDEGKKADLRTKEVLQRTKS